MIYRPPGFFFSFPAQVGADNFFLFGCEADQINTLREERRQARARCSTRTRPSNSFVQYCSNVFEFDMV